MKTIAYTIVKNGQGYVATSVIPANHTEASKLVSPSGLIISGILLALAAAFISFLFLAA